MRIAVQGCSHGELDNIYDAVVQSEQQTGVKVDLLICCGDFQAVRNEYDLKCMKVPKKHQKMGTFWEYYSGKKEAPVLTVFIGGNHEASNHNWELYYGGWVAPKIFYLGAAGVIKIGGLRIGGVSGIYKKYNYHKGHFETPPLSPNEICSIFHIRSLEVMRCKSIKSHLDVFISHDWPIGVYEYGNKDQLIKFKPFFEEEINSHQLGSPPLAELLEHLQPSYWLAGHLHCKFSAIIPHDDFGKSTRFLALDKCLPKRKFLQILDIGDEGASLDLEYDLEWLTILFLTQKYFKADDSDQKLPSSVKIKEEDMNKVKESFGSLMVPDNFSAIAPFYKKNQSHSTYSPIANPQTELFCSKLGIPNNFIPGGNEGVHEELNITTDSDAIDLTFQSDSPLLASVDESGPVLDEDEEANGNMMFSFDKSSSEDDGDSECQRDNIIQQSTEVEQRTDLLQDEDEGGKKEEERKKSDRNITSTPITLKRRLTLPPPRNVASPIFASDNTNKNKTEAVLSPSKNYPLEKGNKVQIVEDDNLASSESSYHRDDKSKSKDLDFNLDESDDQLISKFLSLKKRFNRGLTDSLLVNTSLSKLEAEDPKEKSKEPDIIDTLSD